MDAYQWRELREKVDQIIQLLGAANDKLEASTGRLRELQDRLELQYGCLEEAVHYLAFMTQRSGQGEAYTDREAARGLRDVPINAGTG